MDAHRRKSQEVLQRRLVLKRHFSAEHAYYVCAGPVATALEQLVAVAGSRRAIEDCFAAAENEADLASYLVRDYAAWYRHITLAMLAHAYLPATSAARPSVRTSAAITAAAVRVRPLGQMGQPGSDAPSVAVVRAT